MKTESADEPNTHERLYNGIILPEIWPPNSLSPESSEPMPVPYLAHPPAVIPIDVGRQLFVDDFLIEETDLDRTFHRAKKFEGNPVFKPETPTEIENWATVYLGHGGLFFDPSEKLFKMFYTAGWRGPLAVATSRDMVHWERPDLGHGTNYLLPAGDEYSGPELKSSGTDNSVWFDIEARNSAERIKFLTCWGHVPSEKRPNGFDHTLQTSDGQTWSLAVPVNRIAADYCSFFYNPFRKRWVQSIKQDGTRGRIRYYVENADFSASADWSGMVYWTGADKFDLPEPEGNYPGAGEPAQLYSLNAIAYESVMVGMHYLLRGPRNEICTEGEYPKLTDLELGFSRDGFHWHRPDREGFIKGERTEGTWDRAYLHGTPGVFVILDDKLVFSYTAFSGVAPDGSRGIYHGASIGLAMLRRDGFASMDAGKTAGSLTTRPLTFSGSRLFINADLPQGRLRVEIRDAGGRPIAPFTLENSVPFTGDTTLHEMRWNAATDLSPLAGEPVRFHFELENGSLYSFWVSKDESGRSDGYVAAGGPGYAGNTDTVGKGAFSR